MRIGNLGALGENDSYNRHSMTDFTGSAYRDHYLQGARASALSDRNVVIEGELRISTEAIDRLRSRGTIYWRDARSIAVAKGVDNSIITQFGDLAVIHAYAQAQESYAYGLYNSTLNLRGETEKRVDISAKSRITGTHDPAWGLKDSTVQTSEGDDRISIVADAGAMNLGNWEYRQTQSIKAFGSEGGEIRTGAGNDHVSITAKTSTNNRFNVWSDHVNGFDDAGQGTGRRDLQKVDDASNGEATAIRDSNIDLGSGDDYIELIAIGFSTFTSNRLDWAGARHLDQAAPSFNSSIAIRNSNILLGSGDDRAEITGNFVNAAFSGGSGLDSIRFINHRFSDFSVTKDGSTYYINGNGNSATITGIEQLIFNDQILNLKTDPGVTITGSDFTTSEDDGFDLDGRWTGDLNTASFEYKLDTRPEYDVVIHLAVSDSSEAELSASRLVFTSENWDTAQTVVVKGKDDFKNDGSISYDITQRIETRDLGYNRLQLKNINLINLDDVEDKPVIGIPPHHDWIVRGSNGNDRLYGGYGQQELRGYAGDDRLYGEQDDDWLVGGAGNDLLDGGLDEDTVEYSGRQEDYEVRLEKNGDYTVRDLRGEQGEGLDTVRNIEKIFFAASGRTIDIADAERASRGLSDAEIAGNTTLTKDSFGGAYAKNADGTLHEITYKGSQMKDGFFAGWSILGAEVVNGNNTVAWKHSSGDISIWNTDAKWNYKNSAFYGSANSSHGLKWEQSFNQDFNGDSIIGTSYKDAEVAGNTTLTKDSFGGAYAKNADGTLHEITYKGSQMKDSFFADWLITGAENIEGRNMAAWTTTSGLVSIWETDENWNYTRTVFIGSSNSLAGAQWENDFNQDFNGDLIIGVLRPVA